eukprot:2219781-Prymnesium_polylepis.1
MAGNGSSCCFFITLSRSFGSSSQAEDVADTFRAVGADPRDEKAMVEKSVVSEFMKSMYELDVCRHNPDLSLACPTERALRTRKPPPLLNT